MAGKTSAFGAFAFAVLFAGVVALELSANLGLQPLAPALAALLLLVGGYRTLRKMSGGLRLLSGAWGVAAGLLLQPVAYSHEPFEGAYRASLGALSGVFVLLPFVALGFLLLTALHKET